LIRQSAVSSLKGYATAARKTDNLRVANDVLADLRSMDAGEDYLVDSIKLAIQRAKTFTAVEKRIEYQTEKIAPHFSVAREVGQAPSERFMRDTVGKVSDSYGLKFLSIIFALQFTTPSQQFSFRMQEAKFLSLLIDDAMQVNGSSDPKAQRAAEILAKNSALKRMVGLDQGFGDIVAAMNQKTLKILQEHLQTRAAAVAGKVRIILAISKLCPNPADFLCERMENFA
jgi:hypothetical protein